MPAAIKIPTEFTADDKFSKVVKGMASSVRKFSRNSIAHVKRFDNKLTSTFNKLGRLQQAAIGLGFGALFAVAIQGNLDFEDSLASVSSITGATGKDLVQLETLAKRTAKETKKGGAEVLKAYELVGSAKPELLANAEALDQVTRSTITLSKASRLDLEQSALSLTGVMNQFNLDASESVRTIDTLAAGAKFGAAAIPQISDAILAFGTGAKAANISLEESVALVETFAAKGIKGAEAGTKLRNIISKTAAIDALPKSALDQLEKFGVNTKIVSNAQLPFSERLKELSKIAGNATALVKVFGIENKEAGQILLNNIPMLEEMTKNVSEGGVAQTQAAANTNTLKFALESVRTAFLNATNATSSNSKSMGFLRKSLGFVADNMETVVGVASILLGAFVALKVITGIIQAISAAQAAWTVIMKIGSIANTIFGVTLNAAIWPITLIVLAIAAVIAIIMNWSSITKWFGKQWDRFTKWISGAWNKVVDWFKNFDFKQFFKSIGQSILKFLLWPMKQVLGLVSKLPGKVGNLAKQALDNIKDLTGENEINVNANGTPLPAPEAASAEVTQTTIKQNNLDINIKDKGGNVESTDMRGDNTIPVMVTTTQGQR